MKKAFRTDIVQLKKLYASFRASESFYADDTVLAAYDRYFEKLRSMCSAYGKTPRQIAGAMNI